MKASALIVEIMKLFEIYGDLPVYVDGGDLLPAGDISIGYKPIQYESDSNDTELPERIELGTKEDS